MGVRDDLRIAVRGIARRLDAAPPAVIEPRADGGTSIVNTLTGLGGVNDKGAAGRPNIGREVLTDTELTALYFANGISRRIIDIVPDEMTRKGWKVTITSGDEDPETDASADEDATLHTFDRVNEAKKMARLYGGSIILMVTDDGEKDLSQPLNLSAVTKLLALHVFDAYEAIPRTYESDITAEGYRDPLLWDISPTVPFTTLQGNNTLMTSSAVHASRVLYFRGRKRPPSWRFRGSRSNNVLDDSYLQAIWDEVRNLTSVMAGGATLAQEIRESVVTVAGLAALSTSDQQAQFTMKMKIMAAAKSLLGIIVLGEGDKYENRSNPPTGFKELSGEAQAMLSAVTGYPQTILFGTVPAGLGKDDVAGRQQWDRVIAAEHSGILPQLRKLYSVMFAATEGPTQGKIPDSTKIAFEPLDEDSAETVAKTRKTNAETDVLHMGFGVLKPEQVAEARYGPTGYQQDIVIPEVEEEEELDADAEAEAGAEATGASGDDDLQKTALNGAQSAAMESLLISAASGVLPADTVALALQVAFPSSFTKAEAEAIVPPASPLPVDEDPQRQDRNAEGENARWRAANPAKAAAHIKLANALRDGKIEKRACACGVTKVQAHHTDYSKPLSVTWLCQGCHDKAHDGEKADAGS